MSFVVISLFIVYFIIRESSAAVNVTCSREISRKVTKFLNSDFAKRLSINDLKDLPMSCPLHPKRNVFGEQERNKLELDALEWQVSAS